MAVNDNFISKPYSKEHVANSSFDPEFQVSVTEVLGYDGQNVQRMNADNMALKVTPSGSITYIAKAAPGTSQSEAKWQVKKVDKTSGIVVTWADGNPNFDNVASDLTTLTYL